MSTEAQAAEAIEREKQTSVSLIGGFNSGQHDFGYHCYMPERIIIENLRIDDSHHPENYLGPAIFANFNPEMTDDSYQEKFPYTRTGEVILKNVTTESGKDLRVSDNQFVFQDLVKRKDFIDRVKDKIDPDDEGEEPIPTR